MYVCMYVCVCVCKHVYICICLYICIYMYMYVCVYFFVCVHVPAYRKDDFMIQNTGMHDYAYELTYTFTLYAFTHTKENYAYIHAYIHTYVCQDEFTL